VGGAIGGQVYRSDDAPYYSRGHEICMGLMCGAWVLSLLFKYLLERENKRRENLTPEEHAQEASGEDLCDMVSIRTCGKSVVMWGRWVNLTNWSLSSLFIAS
jgi:hypothetical protein